MAPERAPECAAAAVVALVALQWLAVHAVVGVERLPAVPDLGRFPRTVGAWQAYRDVPVPGGAELGADQLMERVYFHAAKGVSVDLLVAWFRSQRGGLTQPHSPRVCLPGSGWLPVESRRVPLATSLGTIYANWYVVENRGTRAVALYWYQTPRRVMTDEWAAKFFTVADGLRDRRTDTAMVRIFAAVKPDGGADGAADFARAVYPLLRDALPR